MAKVSSKIDNPAKNRSEIFLQYYLSEFPNQETLEYSKKFQKEYSRLEKAIFASKAIFQEIPLVSAFFEWVQTMLSATPSWSKEEFEDAKLLLKYGFIAREDAEGTWTLYHASLQDPNEIYEAIRCQRELSLSQRERLVQAYGRFISYLSFRTCGYIETRIDSDKKLVMNRVVKLENFVHFADHLNDKIQLIAKILYFGDDIALDQVLSLTISDIDFESHFIRYGRGVKVYPLHIYADIKAIIGKRSKGKIFLGRQDTPLNSTTVFRNFKEAGINSGLGTHFSPAYLTKNKSIFGPPDTSTS